MRQKHLYSGTGESKRFEIKGETGRHIIKVGYCINSNLYCGSKLFKSKI